MAKIKIRDLGMGGVNVDLNPLDIKDNELTLAQNVINDVHGSDRGLRKRPGLVELNASSLASSIAGGAPVPQAYSAKPNNAVYVFSSALTTTSATMTSATGLAAGDIVWWVNSSGIPQSNQTFQIESVNGNDITWLPPFSSAPSAGDVFVPAPLKLTYLGLLNDGSSNKGWAVSTSQFATTALDNVTGASPQIPRDYTAANGLDHAAQYAIASCVMEEKLIYASGNYTPGTDYPPIRVWDGTVDREIARIPGNADISSTNVPVGIISIVPAPPTIQTSTDNLKCVYVSTLDVGASDGSTNRGRVFILSYETGQLMVIGDTNATFAAKDNPKALAAHRFIGVWVGTSAGNTQTGFQAKIKAAYTGNMLEPNAIPSGPASAPYTTDKTFAAGYDGVEALVDYKGRLYAATKSNDATQQAAIFKRDLSDVGSGVWTSDDAFSGETDKHGYYSMIVHKDNLIATKFVKTTAAASIIRKTSDAGSWSTVFTATTSNQKVPLLLWQDGTGDNSVVYASGSDGTNQTCLLKSTDGGANWSDISTKVPSNTSARFTGVVGAIHL